MSEAITGGCLCGSIRYTVSQPIENIICCHCTNCQKASGASATHNIVLPSASLDITQGKPKVFGDRAASGRILNRYFCGDCGSPIYSQRETMPDMLVLKAGTLDAPNKLKIVMNIWTSSARPWIHIDPATELYPENRPIKA